MTGKRFAATTSRTRDRLPALLIVGVCFVTLSLAVWVLHEEGRPVDSSVYKFSRVLPVRKSPASPVQTARSKTAAEIYRTAGAEELLALLRGKLSGAAANEVLAALLEIARERPALAIELAQTAGRTAEEKSVWVTDVMQQWAARDPALAWNWLSQQALRMDDLADGSLTGVVFNAMATRDPDRLIATVESLLRPENTSGPFASQVAVHTALDALVKNGEIEVAREAVEMWTRDPEKPGIGTAAYETVALALGKLDPTTAGTWLKSLPVSDERNSALSTFAADWGERDPRAALRWAESLSPEDGQSRAMQRTFGDWIERHSGDAGEWLGDYLLRAPGGSGTDRLITSVINLPATVQEQPMLALHWADLISSPSDRKRQAENVILKWSRRDFSAAINHVWDSPSIAAEEKPALVQKIQNERISGKTYD